MKCYDLTNRRGQHSPACADHKGRVRATWHVEYRDDCSLLCDEHKEAVCRRRRNAYVECVSLSEWMSEADKVGIVERPRKFTRKQFQKKIIDLNKLGMAPKNIALHCPGKTAADIAYELNWLRSELINILIQKGDSEERAKEKAWIVIPAIRG